MPLGDQIIVFAYVWDVGSLSWVKSVQPVVSTDTLNVTLPATAATAAKQDTGNTSLASLDTKTTAVNTSAVTVVSAPTTAVTGTFFQATQPVSAASLPLPTGASTETTLAALNTKVTAVNTGAVVVTSAPTTAVTGPLTDAQLRAAAVPISGTVIDGGAGKTLKSASFSLAATGTVVAAVGGKRIKVFATKLCVSAAISVNFRDGAAAALEGSMPLALSGGFVEVIQPPAFLFATPAGNSLDLVVTGIGTAAGRVSYWDDDAA